MCSSDHDSQKALLIFTAERADIAEKQGKLLHEPENRRAELLTAQQWHYARQLFSDEVCRQGLAEWEIFLVFLANSYEELQYSLIQEHKKLAAMVEME